jgi:hypothetical protein
MPILRRRKSKNRSRLLAIGVESPTALEALARLFIDKQILDDGTARGRLRAILAATERPQAPGMHTAIPFGMSGFRVEFEDPWESSKNQVGHFLTAVRLSFDARFLSIPIYPLLLGGFGHDDMALRLIIGHEKAPDPADPTSFRPRKVINTIKCFRAQYQAAIQADVDNFLAGRLEAIEVGTGLGNSMADLRLSYEGWLFGQLAAGDEFDSKEDMAEWIVRHLGQADA